MCACFTTISLNEVILEGCSAARGRTNSALACTPYAGPRRCERHTELHRRLHDLLDGDDDDLDRGAGSEDAGLCVDQVQRMGCVAAATSSAISRPVEYCARADADAIGATTP